MITLRVLLTRTAPRGRSATPSWCLTRVVPDVKAAVMLEDIARTTHIAEQLGTPARGKAGA